MSENISDTSSRSLDQYSFTTLWAELRALREDVKLLLDIQRTSSINGVLHKQGDTVTTGIVTDANMHEKSSSCQNILCDLKTEVHDLKQTVVSDLNKLKEICGCCENRNSVQSALSHHTEVITERSTNEGRIETIRDVAEAIQRQNKVSPPLPFKTPNIAGSFHSLHMASSTRLFRYHEHVEIMSAHAFGPRSLHSILPVLLNLPSTQERHLSSPSGHEENPAAVRSSAPPSPSRAPGEHSASAPRGAAQCCRATAATIKPAEPSFPGPRRPLRVTIQ